MQWIHEVKYYLKGVPIVLVGCKKDLGYENNELRDVCNTLPEVTPSQVSCFSSSNMKCNVNSDPSQAWGVATRIGALKYFETSALKREGLDQLFLYVAECAMKPIEKKARFSMFGLKK